MTVAEYYVQTFVNAFGKIAPVVAFIGIGYFIFFKLPFLFLLRNMTNYKGELSQDRRKVHDFKSDYSLEDYEDFKRRMNKIQKPVEKEELKSLGGPEAKKKQEEKKEQNQEQKKTQRPKTSPMSSVHEKLFDLQPGQVIKKDDLRKRYHELLRKNHPDKVASLGEEFKTLAEKKTKEINEAYQKLKNKAS